MLLTYTPEAKPKTDGKHYVSTTATSFPWTRSHAQLGSGGLHLDPSLDLLGIQVTPDEGRQVGRVLVGHIFPDV